MENKRRRYHPKFAADLKFANEYYDNISIDLGNRFRKTVGDQLTLISEIPEAFATIHNQVRAARLRNFPYLILYRNFPDHVYVVGFVHAASDRQHWFDRID